jgi:glutamate synthase domain-containing protein 3
MVDLEPVLSESEQSAKVSSDIWHKSELDEIILRRMIENHALYTGSSHAQKILDQWPIYRARFVKIFPKEYRRALTELAAHGKKVAA